MAGPVLIEPGDGDLPVLGRDLGEVLRGARNDGIGGVDGRASGAELV